MTCTRRTTCLTLLTLALSTLPILGCGDDDAGDAAPSISALSYSPDTLPPGQATTIAGTVAFTDPDGDLSQLGVSLTLPDGSVQELPLTALQGYTGQISGQVSLALTLVPPVAGTYDFEVRLIDAAGHESNPLGGTLHAQ